MAVHALASTFLLSSLLLAPTTVLAQDESSNRTAINPHIDGIPSIPETTDCTDVHIFLAKGNNETEAGTRQLKLVDAICSTTPENTTCGHESLHFDNRYETVYCVSLEEGAEKGPKQMEAYAERCPGSKLVVSGYSQGAHIVGDILGGGGGNFFQECPQKTNPPMDPETSPGNKIVAALIIGDTRHTAGQSYNFLSGVDGNGLFPRNGSQLSDLNKFSGVLRAYCASTDPICAEDLGPVEAETHLNYFDVYSQDMAEWVWSKVEEAGGAANATDHNSTSTTSATSTRTSSAADDEETEATTTTSITIPTSADETISRDDAQASETAASGSGAATIGVSFLGAVMPIVVLLSMF